jgi:hypothetical protein
MKYSRLVIQVIRGRDTPLALRDLSLRPVEFQYRVISPDRLKRKSFIQAQTGMQPSVEVLLEAWDSQGGSSKSMTASQVTDPDSLHEFDLKKRSRWYADSEAALPLQNTLQKGPCEHHHTVARRPCKKVDLKAIYAW